jgi:LysM repeat protein
LLTVLTKRFIVWFMNKEQNYHIDVSEEESKLFVEPPLKKEPLFALPKFPKISLSFPKVFCIVLGAHIVLAGVLIGTSTKASAKEEDKKALTEPFPSPTPIPTPAPSPEPTPNVVIQEPVPKVTAKPVPKPSPKPSTTAPKVQSKFTEKYVVKQGDTFDKIVKKYKLNSEKLKKINNIKDTNKIVVGQTLKFL